MNSRSDLLWESSPDEPIAARIAIAGDFLPAGNMTLPYGGWRAAASELAAHFEDIATSFVNLECALDAASLPQRPLLGLGEIVTAPIASLDYLAAIRCHAVGIANNHAYDFYDAGVSQTRIALAQRGFVPLGAGRNLRDAPEVFILQGPCSIRVGFWAAAVASRELATRNSQGVEPAALQRAAQAISILKSRGAQFSIALLHAGSLRTNHLASSDAALMDAISKCGFNIVAASHSHRISGARLLPTRGAPSFCFHGLGSLASGFIGSPLEREGLIVVASLNSKGGLARVELRPVILADSGFGEIPSPGIGAAILNCFHSLSTEIADGSSKRRFYRDISKGLFQLYLRDSRAAFRNSGIRGLARKAARLRMRHVRSLVYRLIA